jgi:hypothetical protein
MKIIAGFPFQLSPGDTMHVTDLKNEKKLINFVFIFKNKNHE